MELTSEELVTVMNEHALVVSGDKAVEWLNRRMKRIGQRRWNRFLATLKQIKFFGGITMLAAEDEPDPINSIKCLEWHSDDNDLVGLYRPLDHWIELIVSRMFSWERMEAVLRHEFVHLLQDIVYTGCRDDINAWCEAESLVRPYGKRAARFSNPIEGEAYWLMNFPGEVKREAQKIQNNPDRWSNWHCSLANYIWQSNGTTDERGAGSGSTSSTAEAI